MRFKRKTAILLFFLIVVAAYIAYICKQTITFDSEASLSSYCLADYWMRINHGLPYFEEVFIPATIGCYVIVFKTTDYIRVMRYPKKVTVFQECQKYIFLWEWMLSMVIIAIPAVVFLSMGRSAYNWNEIVSFYTMKTGSPIRGVSLFPVLAVYFISMLFKNLFFAMLIQLFLWKRWNMILGAGIMMGWCVMEALQQNVPVLINSVAFTYDVWSSDGIYLTWSVALLLFVAMYIYTLHSVRIAEVLERERFDIT